MCRREAEAHDVRGSVVARWERALGLHGKAIVAHRRLIIPGRFFSFSGPTQSGGAPGRVWAQGVGWGSSAWGGRAARLRRVARALEGSRTRVGSTPRPPAPEGDEPPCSKPARSAAGGSP